MTEGIEAIRHASWRDFFPWLILFRAFRVAVSLPVLFLATCGGLATPLGWHLSGFLFVAASSEDAEFEAERRLNATWPDRVEAYRPESVSPSAVGEWWFRSEGQSLLAGVPAVYLRFVDPFARMMDRDLTLRRAAYYLFGGIWNVAVWALVAGAITRIAALQIGRDERIGLSNALRHALKNYMWYLAAPFFPLLGIAVVALPIALLGLLMRLSIGALLAGVLWPLCLLGGFVLAVLSFGLLGGWPLMWPTLSCERGSDAFEAFSRSYSYTFQRPLGYLLLVALSVLWGALCWLFVSQFCFAVEFLTRWAAAWGAGNLRLEAIDAADQGMVGLGGSLMRLSVGVVNAIAAGFNYSFFFCVMTANYLVLRQRVDQAEFDEVFSDEDEQTFELSGFTEESESEASDDSN